MVALDAARFGHHRIVKEETVIDRCTYLPPYTLIGLMLFVGLLSSFIDSKAIAQPTNQDRMHQLIVARQASEASASSFPHEKKWWWVGGAVIIPTVAGTLLVRMFRRKKEPEIFEFARMGEARRAIILRAPEVNQSAAPPAVAARPMPNLRPRNISAQALALAPQFRVMKEPEPARPFAFASAPPAQSEIFKFVFQENWCGPERRKEKRSGIFARRRRADLDDGLANMPAKPVEEEIQLRPLGIA